MTTSAAGILFLTNDNQVLLLKRGNGGDYPGSWCFPGGTTEDDETLEQTAERETIEELGFLPKGQRVVLARRIAEDVDYTTFLQRVPEQFAPKLNGEHVGYMWVDVESLSNPTADGGDEQVVQDAQLFTQVEAHYTVAGTVEEHCGICQHFEAPTACCRVEGPVVFSGWCKLFEKRASE